MNTRLLKPAEAASLISNIFKRPLSVAYLAKLRCVGGGPQFVRSGRYIAYQENELITYYTRQLSKPMDSTSSARIPANPESILGINDRELDDIGQYTLLYTGDQRFDEITKESYPEFDIDTELERAERRWQFA